MNSDRKWASKAFSEVFGIELADRQLTRRDRKALLDAVCEAMESSEMWPTTHLELLVSEECNLRCDYCFMETKSPKTMSPETGMQSVDFLLRECGDAKELGILFFGGEPLMALPTIRAVVEYADRVVTDSGRKIKYSMTTNGTLFDEEVLELCKSHRINPLFSIDGPPEVHDAHRKTCIGTGSFALIEKMLPLIAKHIGKLEVRVTPHPDTVGSLSSSIEYLRGLGFRKFTIGAAHGIEWSEADYEVYDREMKRLIDAAFNNETSTPIPGFSLSELSSPVMQCEFGCRAGRMYISVGADGTLGPCSLIMGTPGLRDRYVFGSVQEGYTNQRLRAEFSILQSYRGEECLHCDVADSCGGGCPGANHKITGSILHPAYQQCQDHRYKLQHRQIWRDYLKQRQNAQSKEIVHSSES